MSEPQSSPALDYLRASEELDVMIEAQGNLTFDDLIAAVELKNKAKDALIESIKEFFVQSGHAVQSETKSGHLWIVTNSLRTPYTTQITYFSLDGKPNGDLQFLSHEEALSELLQSTLLEKVQNYDGHKFFNRNDSLGLDQNYSSPTLHSQ